MRFESRSIVAHTTFARANGSPSRKLSTSRLQSSAREAVWLTLLAALLFVVAFASTALGLSRDAFVVPHVTAVALMTAAYARGRRPDLGPWLGRHAVAAAVLAVLASLYGVLSVLRQPSSPHASGAQLAFEIVWWGVVYGAVDGVALSALPMMMTARALGDADDASTYTKLANGLVMLAAAAAVVAVYHLGFPEFRGRALLLPAVGVGVLTAFSVASRNVWPAIAGHVAMHVAAVLHGAASVMQLPPHS